jgi:hypothetical protein
MGHEANSDCQGVIRREYLGYPLDLYNAQGATRCGMELTGVVHNGVIVPDNASELSEGMRVRITPAPQEEPAPFGQRFAEFKGAIPGVPADLAEQHEHYRLGTPKR